jgi:sec-independent protein translocase protein TatB
MSFGLTFEKLFLIGLVAVFVVGPDKLPAYAAQLARLVKRLRDLARGAETRIRDEMGEEFADFDIKKLDPRQYNPRKIIRDALLEEDVTSSASAAGKGSVLPKHAQPAATKPKENATGAPFDEEST